MGTIYNSIKSWLEQHPVINDNIKYLAVLLLAYILYLITRKVFFKAVQNLTRKTKTEVDNVLFNDKAVRYFSLIVPVYVINSFAYLADGFKVILERTASGIIFLLFLMALGNIITSLAEFYEKKEKYSRQPIKGYAQISKVVMYIFGALFIIGIFTGEKPWVILTGLGALSAVIILIFKDTILSLVASIQISTYELVKIGDWIEMPAFDADGNVVDIALHTIKVQNWDNTYTLLPTYKLVENSFKNWKGMEQSGGRRIKRHISIDMTTIQLIDITTIDTILKNELLDRNSCSQLESTLKDSNYNFTNLGLLIDYLTFYIKGRKDVRQDLTSIVRSLQSHSEGLPVEILAFSNRTGLIDYEKTQREIFEHFFAVLPYFGLKVFQKIGGKDLYAGN